MIEQPPHINEQSQQKALAIVRRDDTRQLISEANDNYWYWSDVKYKSCPAGISVNDFWAAIKFSRYAQSRVIWKKYGLTLFITNKMQQQCHYFDMNFGGTWGSSSVIPNEDRTQYLISSLMEEAISSSQMEGASTTRKVAKEMLRKKISPRSRSEQMIFNNYNSIRFITEHKNEDLSPELLLRIHSLMTHQTLDSSNDEGRFRTSDDIVVGNDLTGEIVHNPPAYTEIPVFVDELCKFANNDNEDSFIHPIIKAIVIHFMVAYVHPFVDGNGRTARALFYWYMQKKGYWLTEYLSISRVIYKSKTSYERSYLYTEFDGGDMGYFVTYNLKVLELAFKELQAYIRRKVAQRQGNTNYIINNGVNERQAAIISLFRDNPQMAITVKEIENRFGVSQPTARLDLEGLVGKGFLTKVPVNKVKSNYVKSEHFDRLISPDSSK
ncbi:MAG: Fic family protein [Bacteroidales bacterium]|nr:Fic family protein [Bacteroidales bacterium]